MSYKMKKTNNSTQFQNLIGKKIIKTEAKLIPPLGNTHVHNHFPCLLQSLQ